MSRKSKKGGFSLIEVIIAIAISSFLTLAVYRMFNTLSSGVARIEQTMNTATPLYGAYKQLERDCAGIALVVRLAPSSPASATSGKNGEKGQQSATQERQNEEALLFECKHENGMLASWTYISTNPLAVYDSPSPHLVRVRYQVKPDAHNPGLYRLERQESPHLLLKNFEDNKVRAYELLSHIRALKLRFLVRETDKKSDEQPVFKELTQWQPPETSGEQAPAHPQQLLPSFVIVEGIVGERTTSREYAFHWIFPVFVDSMLTPSRTTGAAGEAQKQQQIGLTERQQNIVVPRAQHGGRR